MYSLSHSHSGLDDQKGTQFLHNLVRHALHDAVLVHAVIATATVHKRAALANCRIYDKPRFLHSTSTGWRSTHRRHKRSLLGPEQGQGSHLRQLQEWQR